jgi:hypothetical protein
MLIQNGLVPCALSPWTTLISVFFRVRADIRFASFLAFLMRISRTLLTLLQICRLCYHRIVKNETGTCPACRAEYKEENIQKKSLPEKKKKEGDVEPGWEQPAAGKKKPNKEKKPALPAYPGACRIFASARRYSCFLRAGFPAKVRELLLRCHEIGHVVRGELDERVLEDLKALPEKGFRFSFVICCFHGSESIWVFRGISGPE